jgi:hypothetical protein
MARDAKAAHRLLMARARAAYGPYVQRLTHGMAKKLVGRDVVFLTFINENWMHEILCSISTQGSTYKLDASAKFMRNIERRRILGFSPPYMDTQGLKHAHPYRVDLGDNG